MTPDELRRLEDLERQMREHNHQGTIDAHVNLRDILGSIEVVSVAPAGKPTTIGGQLKIYSNGATYRLYWYDTVAGAWRYATGT
jgi:hypothetical protein